MDEDKVEVMADDKTPPKNSYVSVLILAAMAMLFFGAATFLKAQTKPLWDPLGDYPVQTVNLEKVAVEPALTGPGDVVRPTLKYVTGNEVIPIHATKCNNDVKDVNIRGRSEWRLVDYPGTFVKASEGQAVRKAGCQQFDFRNPLPTEVKDRIKVLHDEGINYSVWQVQGNDTPIGPDNLDGVPRYWHSENFAIQYAVP